MSQSPKADSVVLATQNGLGEHFALLGHDDVVMFQKVSREKETG